MLHCAGCTGEYQESLRAGISTALARLRDYDADTREGLSQELAQAAEFLDQAARLAMASMLQVQTYALTGGVLWLQPRLRIKCACHTTSFSPAAASATAQAHQQPCSPSACATALVSRREQISFLRLQPPRSTLHSACLLLQGPVFDTDARRAQGPVLRWIDRLLYAPPLGISTGAVPAVPKDAVGRTALLNLLRSNLEMFSVYVDRCYDGDARVATASFQVRQADQAHVRWRRRPSTSISIRAAVWRQQGLAVFVPGSVG